MLKMQKYTANLILKDGTIITGVLNGFHSQKTTSGEVVFATGMVGYPEALTDPSFAGQIVVFTYPLMGNYGVPSFTESVDGVFESRKIWAAGVIVQNVYDDADHATSGQSFVSWLESERVPLMSSVDTRSLTKHLRESGTMLGRMSVENSSPDDNALGNRTSKLVKWVDPNAYNIVADVSTKEMYTYGNGSKNVVLIDCGVKYNIVRGLAQRDCAVHVVPWDWDGTGVGYDGVFISNGPGNPIKCAKTINTIKGLLKQNKPVFGICLGNQLLALAAGAKTAKLPYGHRSQNQPCTDLTTGRCYITTQNHGFHVKSKTLPCGWEDWFVNANDGSNEGIRHRSKPFASVQFHPEARPGPDDTSWLFDEYVKLL